MKTFRICAVSLSGISLFLCAALMAADVRLDLDCSESMNDKRKAEYAKAAAQLLVAMLDDDSTLQVVAFNSFATPSPVFRMNVPGQREAAIRWIGRLTIGGRTDYRAALKAAPPPDQGISVFLSDGEHNGLPEPVIDELQKRYVGRCRLYSISVDCAAGSPAEQLLTRMASTTGGSHTRVEKSDQLVTTFADIAVRIGKFRTYRPTEREVQFRAGQGHVLAIGFDGNVELLPTIAAQSQRSHQADLPDEDVDLRAAEFGEASDVLVRLSQPRTNASRLAEIHRDDLPSANLTVDTQEGRASAGSQMTATLSFEDGGKPFDSQQAAGITGEVEVRDAKGRVLNTIPVLPCQTPGCLKATVPIPKQPGPITLRGISTVQTPEGHNYVQRDDVTVVVEQPAKLFVKPNSISRQVKPGRFDVELELTTDETTNSLSTATARLAKDVPACVCSEPSLSSTDCNSNSSRIVSADSKVC